LRVVSDLSLLCPNVVAIIGIALICAWIAASSQKSYHRSDALAGKHDFVVPDSGSSPIRLGKDKLIQVRDSKRASQI
jgi:hypothetical protein